MKIILLLVYDHPTMAKTPIRETFTVQNGEKIDRTSFQRFTMTSLWISSACSTKVLNTFRTPKTKEYN